MMRLLKKKSTQGTVGAPNLLKNTRKKENCPKEGYADALDCKINEAEVSTRGNNTTKPPKKQIVDITPIFVRQNIFELIASQYTLKENIYINSHTL